MGPTVASMVRRVAGVGKGERQLRQRLEQIAERPVNAPIEANRVKWRRLFLRKYDLLGEPPTEHELREQVELLWASPFLLAAPDPSTVQTVYRALEVFRERISSRKPDPRELARRVDDIIEDYRKHGLKPDFAEARQRVAKVAKTTVEAVRSAHLDFGRHKGKPGRPKNRG